MKTKTITKMETKRVKTPTQEARAPRAGSPAFVSIFVIVFVFICVFALIYSTSANLLNIRLSEQSASWKSIEARVSCAFTREATPEDLGLTRITLTIRRE